MTFRWESIQILIPLLIALMLQGLFNITYEAHLWQLNTLDKHDTFTPLVMDGMADKSTYCVLIQWHSQPRGHGEPHVTLEIVYDCYGKSYWPNEDIQCCIITVYITSYSYCMTYYWYCITSMMVSNIIASVTTIFQWIRPQSYCEYYSTNTICSQLYLRHSLCCSPITLDDY